MLRNTERIEGYNIFLGVGDTVERSLSILQDKVREAEKDFIIDVKSQTTKYGETRDRDNIYSIQVAMLKRRWAAPIHDAPAEATKASKKVKP